jgi:uncharacterized protein (UPF0548 family)
MLKFSKPDQAEIHSFISAQRDQPFSYPEAGDSAKQIPSGYATDHNRIQLGRGVEDYERAKKAVSQWKMFSMPWIDLCWPETPIEPGATVAVLVSHFGFWSLNACRIVYVIEERGPLKRYGFAYGTLPGHKAIGEERFMVEHNTYDGSVWYDIFAFSRPKALARLAYPLTRAIQKRFAKDSKAAMLKAAQRRSSDSQIWK